MITPLTDHPPTVYLALYVRQDEESPSLWQDMVVGVFLSYDAAKVGCQEHSVKRVEPQRDLVWVARFENALLSCARGSASSDSYYIITRHEVVRS